MKMAAKLFFLFFCLVPIIGIQGWKNDESVRLTDIEVLTLYHGRMTKGRRSSPVPQLKCVGGSAGCNAFIPQVVQCYNRGSDGEDVQWECKTDMDNAYRFGRISVSCEGYSYPDDPYILKGSCGLEYTIDLTKEGSQQQKGHSYYGQTGYQRTDSSRDSSGLGNFLVLLVILLVMYALYKTCIAPSFVTRDQYSSTNDDFGGRPGGGFGSFFRPSAPPPPGFNPTYTDGCGTASAGTTGGSSAGGFWTGAATGGLLGYMFGRSSTGNQSYARHRPDYSSNYSWGGTSEQHRSSSPTGGSSTGTRSASGFGGTSRR